MKSATVTNAPHPSPLPASGEREFYGCTAQVPLPAGGERVPDRAGEGFMRVCGLLDIPVLGARVIERPHDADGNVAVFRTADDRVFAVLDRCPHKGGPLSQGIVFGDRVACPLHNWTIELGTGEAVAPDVGCARRFPVKIDDGIVYIDLG